MSETLQQYLNVAVELFISYAPRLALAILTFYVGFALVRTAVRVVDKALKLQNVDASLAGFLESMVSVSLKALVLITVANMVGVEMTSFIAILGAAGLAIGLSLQGSLANLAGGILILLFKPYAVGDAVEAQGFSGVVRKIEIFNTILETDDGRTIIIPNGQLSNGSIVNFSADPNRRVDVHFVVEAGEDAERVKELVRTVLSQQAHILPQPAPSVGISKLADSSVHMTASAWVKNEHYGAVQGGLLEGIHRELRVHDVKRPVR